MKNLFAQYTEDKFEVLTNEEMNVVRGGTDDGPRSKDKDVFDLGDE